MPEVEELILANGDLVEREARRVSRRLSLVEHDDLLGDGNLALVHAAGRFRAELGVPFRAFATRRIRGSMLDAIRKAVRRRHVDGELIQLSSLDANVVAEPEAQNADVAAAAQRLQALSLLATLPDREREVLVRTRIEGESYREVAEEMGIGVSLVARLNKRAEARMRIGLRRQVA